ncbi:hypothetical protein SAMN05421679_105157 [Epilithonimonas pallida]|uniref:Uncharacterized protein n=1 Tax=Epilithonimonas pallida TaxID=373671 RepID=A0ABY1R329_9FLAO|nr:hypothetical protein SAMN05421679_105157 [Epilithonimonas pallida]
MSVLLKYAYKASWHIGDLSRFNLGIHTLLAISDKNPSYLFTAVIWHYISL